MSAHRSYGCTDKEHYPYDEKTDRFVSESGQGSANSDGVNSVYTRIS